MKRRLLGIAAVIAAVAGTVVLVAVPSVGAATLDDAGWWSRVVTHDPVSNSPQPLPVENPTVPDTVPVGAVVGPDQFVVEGTAEGATAITALRWTLPTTESLPTLTLPVAEGSVIPPNAVVLACRAAVAWKLPQTLPGRWETKPTTDPTKCINGVVAADGASITFGVQALVTRGVLDLVLVPGRNPDIPREAGQASGSVMRWVFATPGTDALEVVTGTGFDEGAGSVDVTLPTLPNIGGTGSSVALPTSGGSLPSSSPSRPDVTSSGDSSGVAAPSLGPEDLGDYVPRPDEALLAAAERAAQRSRNTGVVLLLLAAACAAWAYFSAPGAEAATIGLGRFAAPVPAASPAEPVSGGLGRFARTRREPPVPLS